MGVERRVFSSLYFFDFLDFLDFPLGALRKREREREKNVILGA